MYSSPGSQLRIRITQQRFEKIRNRSWTCLFGPGKVVRRKNRWQQISWHCSFPWSSIRRFTTDKTLLSTFQDQSQAFILPLHFILLCSEGLSQIHRMRNCHRCLGFNVSAKSDCIAVQKRQCERTVHECRGSCSLQGGGAAPGQDGLATGRCPPCGLPLLLRSGQIHFRSLNNTSLTTYSKHKRKRIFQYKHLSFLKSEMYCCPVLKELAS
jgi:hypothetical protein